MGKIVIWAIVLLFGYVCIALVIGVFALQSGMRKLMQTLPAHEGANVVIYQHDSYCTISPGIRVTLHPRPWAAALVGIGFGLVVLGLVYLLHVPVENPL
jgi:hypothetical protein